MDKSWLFNQLLTYYWIEFINIKPIRENALTIIEDKNNLLLLAGVSKFIILYKGMLTSKFY